MVQKDENLCQIIGFACPYDGRVDTKDLEKIKVEKERKKDMEHESKVYTTSDMWSRKNTHKVTKLVHRDRY